MIAIPIVVRLCGRVYGVKVRAVFLPDQKGQFIGKRICNQMAGHTGDCTDGGT